MASDTKVASASTDGFTGPLSEGSLLSRLYVAGLVRQVVTNDGYLRAAERRAFDNAPSGLLHTYELWLWPRRRRRATLFDGPRAAGLPEE